MLHYDQLLTNEKAIYIRLDFNDHGDWIKAMRYDEGEDGREVHLIIREMEYFD